ncbi:unnamed protein product [Amoebophrya sp. A120]|nr:unnamed protein product [Amoebophrya sp. A120]|eukprot:GSA120T00002456001.1
MLPPYAAVFPHFFACFWTLVVPATTLLALGSAGAVDAAVALPERSVVGNLSLRRTFLHWEEPPASDEEADHDDVATFGGSSTGSTARSVRRRAYSLPAETRDRRSHEDSYFGGTDDTSPSTALSSEEAESESNAGRDAFVPRRSPELEHLAVGSAPSSSGTRRGPVALSDHAAAPFFLAGQPTAFATGRNQDRTPPVSDIRWGPAVSTEENDNLHCGLFVDSCGRIIQRVISETQPLPREDLQGASPPGTVCAAVPPNVKELWADIEYEELAPLEGEFISPGGLQAEQGKRRCKGAAPSGSGGRSEIVSLFSELGLNEENREAPKSTALLSKANRTPRRLSKKHDAVATSSTVDATREDKIASFFRERASKQGLQPDSTDEQKADLLPRRESKTTVKGYSVAPARQLQTAKEKAAGRRVCGAVMFTEGFAKFLMEADATKKGRLGKVCGLCRHTWSRHGGKLRLRGRGSRHLEDKTNMEANIPLQICVSGVGAGKELRYRRSIEEIQTCLRETFADEWRAWCRNHETYRHNFSLDDETIESSMWTVVRPVHHEASNCTLRSSCDGRDHAGGSWSSYFHPLNSWQGGHGSQQEVGAPQLALGLSQDKRLVTESRAPVERKDLLGDVGRNRSGREEDDTAAADATSAECGREELCRPGDVKDHCKRSAASETAAGVAHTQSEHAHLVPPSYWNYHDQLHYDIMSQFCSPAHAAMMNYASGMCSSPSIFPPVPTSDPGQDARTTLLSALSQWLDEADRRL